MADAWLAWIVLPGVGVTVPSTIASFSDPTHRELGSLWSKIGEEKK